MIGALLLSASLWTPAELAAVRNKLDTALSSPTLRGAHVGLLAVDTAGGPPIYDRNAADAFIPASTFKLIAGSAALARLGSAFTFVTEVRRSPTSLTLVGGGDVLITAKDLDDAAVAVSASGPLKIDTLCGDATRYRAPRYPDGWSIDDLPYGYAAIPSALSLEENTVHAYVRTGNAAGAAAQLESAPATGAFTVENAMTTGARGSQDTTDVERPWDRPDVIRLTGSYPLGSPVSDDIAPAVPDPVAYALDVFHRALLQHGASVATIAAAQAPADATLVWRHASAPLSQMLGSFWQPSDNLLGEQLLLELGASAAVGRDGMQLDTRAAGIEAEKAWLRSIGVDPATLTIADGSGLSEYDRITPAALVAILNAGWNGPQRSTVLDALPLAGVRGTLKTSFTGTSLAGNVFAKTGTINHARTLAGYVRTPHHGTIAFALLINDWMDASPQSAKAMERVRRVILQALRD
jgi:D-alanyl-D-alanine carboxypeptidase/D-alanyl-D-alanine-endopeptidase (penicillin-binding protein 4)